MEKILSHYTQFPVLLGILKRKTIVLGNPSNWQDKSDKRILEEYVGHKNIMVMSLTEIPKDNYDNILLWKTYASGISGCRIDFNKDVLIDAVESQGAKIEKMDYSECIDEKLRKDSQIIPFLKRRSYSYENEWRIVWVGEKGKKFELDISDFFDKKIIWKVKLSSELPKNLAKDISSFLKVQYKIEANQSWIYQDTEWEDKILKRIQSTHTSR